MSDALDVFTTPPQEEPNRRFRIRSRRLWMAVFAEFFGQSMFVFLTLLSFDRERNERDHTVFKMKVMCASGLAHMLCAHLTYHLSGGHINPAITIAAALAGRISFLRGFLYLLGQFLGVFLGCVLLELIVSKEHLKSSMDSTEHLHPDSVMTEYFSTVILVLIIVVVYLASTDWKFPQMEFPSIPTGLVIILGNLCEKYHAGVRLSPSLYLGLVYTVCGWEDLYVFGWEAPVYGGILGSLVYTYVLRPHTRLSRHSFALSSFSRFERHKSRFASRYRKSRRTTYRFSNSDRKSSRLQHDEHRYKNKRRTRESHHKSEEGQKSQDGGMPNSRKSESERQRRHSRRYSHRDRYRDKHWKSRDSEETNSEEMKLKASCLPSPRRSRASHSIAVGRRLSSDDRRHKDRHSHDNDDAGKSLARSVYFFLMDDEEKKRMKEYRRSYIDRRHHRDRRIESTDLDRASWKHNQETDGAV